MTVKTQIPPSTNISVRMYRLQRLSKRALLYSILVLGAVLVLVPLAWSISTSLKTTTQALTFPPVWIPQPIVWRNYVDALTSMPFHIFYANSLIIAVLRVLGVLISSSLVAYGFARLRFPGRHFLFILVLSTLMIPFQVLIIPRFVLFRELGWLDSLAPLIVPSFFGGGALAIFLLRQYFMSIPTELDDAAKIDGCGPFATFWRIVLPLSRPALGAVAVFEVLDTWDDFLGPLIYISSPENFTVELGLNAMRTEYFTEWNLFMAASLVAMIVPISIFFVAQKHFISGIAIAGSGGVKG